VYGNLVQSWGVVQLVGHLTVNEDGEGSNPSAPANLIDFPWQESTVSGKEAHPSAEGFGLIGNLMFGSDSGAKQDETGKRVMRTVRLGDYKV
jgi:hypothetical protein